MRQLVEFQNKWGMKTLFGVMIIYSIIGSFYLKLS